ncbi:hypothetical protein EDM54_04085 [Brevibacillus borstelensis]|nr:hypothetical protein EDM54_04085 [Brevibacillus borstelensis]
MTWFKFFHYNRSAANLAVGILTAFFLLTPKKRKWQSTADKARSEHTQRTANCKKLRSWPFFFMDSLCAFFN